MAEFGIDNFLYERTVEGKTVNFKFRDQFDVNNTAEVSVGEKEFPEGTNGEAREVAEYAYKLVAEQMNEKRAAKAKADAEKQASETADASAQVAKREAEYTANRQDADVKPSKVESDGTQVFNTAGAEQAPKKK